MYIVLDKDTIEMEIVPFIPATKRGFPLTAPMAETVNAIFYSSRQASNGNIFPLAVVKISVVKGNVAFMLFQNLCPAFQTYTPKTPLSVMVKYQLPVRNNR